ncbi:MAG: NAD-dependent protein deacetylase [Betaproteobacteria bacterium]|nr:NAD-dependent protein deacetylase [Betaproteobacteria bacterium]
MRVPWQGSAVESLPEPAIGPPAWLENPLTPDADLEALAACFVPGPAAVLTGAGLSTASGLAAYRDESGAWQHRKPILQNEFLTVEATRRRYWTRSYFGWPRMDEALPNGGHRALATLEAAGCMSGLVTQNVDGLHGKAGSRCVVELHGAVRDVICLACAARFPRHEVQAWIEVANPDLREHAAAASSARPDGDAAIEDSLGADLAVPPCPDCGGILKPDVVFFGDSVPRERSLAAATAVDTAASLIVVGSSLMVYSGYRLVERAQAQGKPVIAINRGATRADPLLALKISGDCVAALEELCGLLGFMPMERQP